MGLSPASSGSSSGGGFPDVTDFVTTVVAAPILEFQTGTDLDVSDDGSGNALVTVPKFGGNSARGDYGTAGATNIANGASGDLGWLLAAGTALLDLTSPTIPTIAADGIYAFTIVAQVNADLTVGGNYRLTLLLSLSGGATLTARQTAANATAAAPRPSITLSTVIVLAAGATVGCSILNSDGAAARNFQLQEAKVQLLA